MPSPDTPSPQPGAPPREGGLKASAPTIAMLGVFLTILLGMFAWFDNRFANGLDGVERRLTAQIDGGEKRLTARIDGVEKRLSDRIDHVETSLGARIDRVEKRLTDRIDRVETELGARIDRVESGLGTRIDEVKADLEASEARQSAAAKRLTAGIAENGANHRELVGFVRAHFPGAPQPPASEPEPAPAQ